MTMAQAHFPMQGPIDQPTRADYDREGGLIMNDIPLGAPDHIVIRLREAADRFFSVSRRLTWTPSFLRQMRDAA